MTESSTVNGKTRLYVIIGDPIDQVRSPTAFNGLFQRKGINAIMVAIKVAPTDLATVMAGLDKVGNVHGIVVTVPHKVTATALADRLSSSAREVGAINCLRRGEDGRWHADMFDGHGFVRGLETHGIDPRHQRVFQAGAGGAGKAIAHALVAAEVRSLDLVDVDKSKESALIQQLGGNSRGCLVRQADQPGPEHDIVINASPCGMTETDPLPFSIDKVRQDAVVADVIMKPEWTLLLRSAQKRGVRTHSGQHMLDGQLDMVAEFFGFH